MRSPTRRKVEIAIALALLSVFLVGSMGRALAGLALLLGAVAVGAYYALGRLWPMLQRSVRAKGPRPVIELAPPPERYGRRPEVRLMALAGPLEQSELGALERRDDRLRLVTREGDWLELLPEDPEQVGISSLGVQTTSEQLAVLALDALVRKLGPLTVRLDGGELFLDGTRPRVELEREVHELRMHRLRQASSQLEELEGQPRPLRRDPPGSEYLN